MTGKTCCAPARDDKSEQAAPSSDKPALASGRVMSPQTVIIDGGRSLLGTDTPYHDVDEESPLRVQKIKSFKMDAYAVTNARFYEFVAATGYITDAERLGDSFVFAGFLPPDTAFTNALAEAPWWRPVRGASWHTPFGPESDQKAEPDHPVTHVSWHDACAFADWAGGRLPLEAEWEHAARGGLGDVTFPWGDDAPNDHDFFPCNIWQGRFPMQNLAKDGFVGTAPVDQYDPNGYGLYNMSGNVWEWTAQDFRVRSMKKAIQDAHAGKAGYKIVKGGSFLCHISYCYRYRIAARTANSPDSSTSHTGFRLVYDI